MIYFDHNATSPLIRQARDAWIHTTQRLWANPSSPHRLGARAERALEEARETVADHLGCSPFNLVWTSGATESNNALFFNAAQAAQKTEEIWLSAIEHPSALAAAHRWFPSKVRLLKVTPNGVVDLEDLGARFRTARPLLVSVMAANNETGVLQPWREVLALCRQHEVPFACDAAQWIGKEPSAGLGSCDYVVGSGHKFGGPFGVGFIKVPTHFHAWQVGGPQEDGRRAGTENLPGIAAMVAAWTERESEIPSGVEIRHQWRDEFIAQLIQRLPGVEILGGAVPRLWNTVAALMPAPPDCRRRWVVQLDKLGFAVSTGSACSSGKEKPSHVLTAMGYGRADGDRMLRFSAGWETTESDWMGLLEVIGKASVELSKATPRAVK